MNITNIQNTKTQSFGMALKLKNNASKKIAEKIYSYSDTDRAKRIFMNDIAKPIDKLKSKVTYDGKQVFVESENNKDIIEVLDTNEYGLTPYLDGKNSKTLCTHIKRNGQDDIYKIHYSVTNEEFYSISNNLASFYGDELKLRLAGEIAHNLDKQNSTMATRAYTKQQKAMQIEKTAEELKNLFG